MAAVGWLLSAAIDDAQKALLVGHSALLGTDGNKQLPSYQADAISLGAGEGA